jgi:hypothetical protein
MAFELTNPAILDLHEKRKKAKTIEEIDALDREIEEATIAHIAARKAAGIFVDTPAWPPAKPKQIRDPVTKVVQPVTERVTKPVTTKAPVTDRVTPVTEASDSSLEVPKVGPVSAAERMRLYRARQKALETALSS